MKKYKFADLIISMEGNNEPLKSQLIKYEYQGKEEVDINIPALENVIEKYHSLYPHLTIGECEYMIKGAYFYKELLKYDGILLHSSCVVKDGSAYLFSAPSGTGKSTHTSLWLKVFKDAKILNDDKPAIIVRNNKLYACGTPFSGKNDLSLNEIYPIQGIAFLERSKDNWIKRMDDKKAIFSIFNQTIRPGYENEMDDMIKVVEHIVSICPIYQFGCNMENDAVYTSYNYMREKHED